MKNILLTLALILILPNLSLAQSFTLGDKLWLSAYFDLQKQKMKLEERIKEIDLKIAQNEQGIRQINELLAKIQRTMIIGTEKQKEDAQKAKPVAEKALMQAKETQKMLKDQKMECEMQMVKIQENERKLKELYSKISSNNNIAGLIKDCSGTVKIMNLKTKKLENTCSNMIINDGDKISTLSDGKIELKISNGQGNFIVGPDSEVLIKKISADEDNFELIQGKFYTKVERSDEYLQEIKDYIQNYKEDLKTIKDWTEEKIEEYKKELLKKRYQLTFKLCKVFHPGTKVIIPQGGCLGVGHLIAVLGIRGTEFTVEMDNSPLAKIIVIEGNVELNNYITKETENIPEGYQVIINLGEPTNIKKIERLEKWWER
uniref:FecR protein domain-containing protein n=1 Tax=Thermodesulfobacterium geofontis TaxID=1295609 RepID=A0A7C4JTQ6_9BACT